MSSAKANSNVDAVPPLPAGDKNENPQGIGFFALLAEDFRTYDRNPMEPGFWAVAVHRFGNWRMGLRPKPLRAPATIVYRTLRTCVHWGWGIKLDYTVKLGRRVRIWHHGGMVLGARSIGDDVHIRQNTTFGIPRRTELNAKPIIGDRVDIGCGAVLLGHIQIGADSVIGANSVLTHDVPPKSVVVGNPARVVKSLDAHDTPALAAPAVAAQALDADGGMPFGNEATTGVVASVPEAKGVSNADASARRSDATATGPWRARA